MFAKNHGANSSNQHEIQLDLLHHLSAVDLSEDQMEACSGGNIRGILLLSMSVVSTQLFTEFEAELATLRGRVD